MELITTGKHMVFIDWITISQTHSPEGEELLPIVAASINTKSDYETGEIEYQSLGTKRVEGSFSTSIGVKCDGYTVSLSGNVGRLGRPDNLFNLDFDQTIQKCNEILAQFNLPPFTSGKRLMNPNPSKYDIKKGIYHIWTGATISQIHLTCNYSTGSAESAQSVINWLDSQSVSHIKKSRSGGSTVSYGSKSSRKLFKAYIKYLEMLAHKKSKREKGDLEESRVFKFCRDFGIVRGELEAHRLMLRDKKLRFLGDITMAKLIKLYDEESEVFKRVKVDQDRIDILHLPKFVQQTALTYLRGDDPKLYLSKSAFYRHAKILREYGIDISEVKNNVISMPVAIRYIDIKPVSAPDWYWKEQNELRLVS